MEIFTIFTLLLGFVGVIANIMLIFVILLRTPAHMRVYSKILLASACCDLICLIGMMSSITKEFIVGTACLMEMYGVCTQHSVSLCAYIFGVQELMYSATSALLSLSFWFRLQAIESTSGKRSNQFSLFAVIVIIVVNTPLIPLYHHALTIPDPAVDAYRMKTGHSALTIMQYADPFTLWLVNYSMLSSLVPFLACLKLRKMILSKLQINESSMSAMLKQQHTMLVRALNIQLLASSGFLVGCVIFSFNLFLRPIFPFIPETTALAVPIPNLQNVITPISNLYVITPYRNRRVVPINENSVTQASVAVVATAKFATHTSTVTISCRE